MDQPLSVTGHRFHWPPEDITSVMLDLTDTFPKLKRADVVAALLAAAKSTDPTSGRLELLAHSRSFLEELGAA